MRFFRVLSGDEVYEFVRSSLDLAWGHPNAETKTETCLPPAPQATRDSVGRVMVAVEDAWCEYEPAKEMIPQLVAASAIEEITADEWRSQVILLPLNTETL
jgi:hypothetical protein